MLKVENPTEFSASISDDKTFFFSTSYAYSNSTGSSKFLLYKYIVIANLSI